MKRLAGALTMAATLVLAAPAPAQAAPLWSMAECVEADLRTAQQDTESEWLVLSGTGTACVPVSSTDGFRIATYRPGEPTGVGKGYNIRLFDRAYTGQRPARDFAAAIGRAEPGEYGVCLLAGDNERVGCGLITVVEDEKVVTVTLTPLPVDAPLVAKAVVTSPYTGRSNPPVTGGVCATCF